MSKIWHVSSGSIPPPSNPQRMCHTIWLAVQILDKFYILEGTEFGDKEGNIIIDANVLYGLRYSLLLLHERFDDCLRNVGFFMFRLDLEIWMHQNGDIYEDIAICVDLLSIAAREPKILMDELENKYKFKFRGTGPI